MKLKNKFIIVLMILILIFNIILPFANATEINKADLEYQHEIKTHIMYYTANNWYEIKCGYIGYRIAGVLYPAYCISHGIHGIDEEGPYTVTINDLLKDTLIYNTIRSGYPYKTPTQLGVETIDDAYVATKQAVYSVILGRDVYSFYKPMDEKGQKIVDAIYNISQQGKNGNNLNFESSCNINKVGNLVEENLAYYQEYYISANGGIKSFNIEEITGFPQGVYITDISGNIKNNFEGEEHFRVVIPKELFNNDINGSIIVKAISNANPIFYGEAPKSNVQNYAITYKVDAQYSKSDNLNIKTNNAVIKVIKRDEETLEPIDNVTFGLYNDQNEKINEVTTGKDGVIEFIDLYQGKYYLKELQTNSNYIKDDTVYEVNAEYSKTIIKTITNKHKKGNLKLIKVDKDDNSITLGGIEFDLIDEDNKIVQHLITDVNGEVNVKDINIGTYTLRETLTKREYNLCVDNNITVKWNETTELTIENEKMKGQLEIYKFDKEDKTIKLKGVEFEVLDENNNFIEKLVTDRNGYAITSRLLVGTYYLKETKTNDKYVLNNTPIKIEIENNKINKLDIENQKIKGKIKIIKTSFGDSNIINVRSGERLSQVCFEIYDLDNNLVDTITTNEDGIAISKYLEKGRYKVIEKSTIKGFLMSTDEFLVNIEEHNELKTINIGNIPADPKLKIIKSGQDYAEKNEEIDYTFDIQNTGNVELNDFTWTEIIPYEQINVTKLVTGTYNQDINYNILYKTNLNEYRLLKECNTQINEYLDLSNIGLINNEIITDIKVEFGSVEINFKSTVNPAIYAKVNDNAKKDEVITNKTKLTGKYDEYNVEDESEFKTIIKEKEIVKKLPKTGG